MKIYVSSTYRDLHQHRVAVDRTMRRMGHDAIGMEQYVAESNRPLIRCLGDVATADVYVLIRAWRYGHVPTEDNPGLHSITELEFRQAIAHHKTVLAFLLDPDSPWPPNAMDSASADRQAADNISRLRSEVGRDYLAGVFNTPEDLASQLAAAVATQGFSNKLVEKLLNKASVSGDDMGGFGAGEAMSDTSIEEIK